MSECWNHNAAARLTSLRVKKSLQKLLENAELNMKVWRPVQLRLNTLRLCDNLELNACLPSCRPTLAGKWPSAWGQQGTVVHTPWGTASRFCPSCWITGSRRIGPDPVHGGSCFPSVASRSWDVRRTRASCAWNGIPAQCHIYRTEIMLPSVENQGEYSKPAVFYRVTQLLSRT